jgi:hypothetical protein
MNNRVKELARQAGLIAPYGSDREGLSDFDYREFANLIVKECARLADNSPQYIDGREILEHFGVE